jgi:hypothetical protein
MWSREDGGAAHAGPIVWVGCPTRGRGETDAVLEVREKEVQFESFSAGKAAGVLGVGEIATIRSGVR